MAQIVVIEVNGGIAEVTEKPVGVEVHILDFDDNSPDYLKASKEAADMLIEPDDNAACEHRTDSDHEETPRNGTSYCVICGDVGCADPTDPEVRHYHGDSFDLRQQLEVAVLTWTHKHGRDTTVYATEAWAVREAAAIVQRDLDDTNYVGDYRNAVRRVRRALKAGRDWDAVKLWNEHLAEGDDICIETLPVQPESKLEPNTDQPMTFELSLVDARSLDGPISDWLDEHGTEQGAVGVQDVAMRLGAWLHAQGRR
jgi:hypothetical protein